uniref:Uncharacterized protein n=1 Tax=Cacopsylla melanoneura TaxID=428564 RepID=A0A8D8YJC8_9HEMI
MSRGWRSICNGTRTEAHSVDKQGATSSWEFHYYCTCPSGVQSANSILLVIPCYIPHYIGHNCYIHPCGIPRYNCRQVFEKCFPFNRHHRPVLRGCLQCFCLQDQSSRHQDSSMELLGFSDSCWCSMDCLCVVNLV